MRMRWQRGLWTVVGCALGPLLALAGLVAAPMPASGAELIGNSSAELGTTTPTGWTSRIFGVNTTAFTWSTNGHTGSRSLRIDTTTRTGGDAKWYFTPVPVVPSTTYTYSFWARSTVLGQIVAEYKTAVGVVTTKWLADIAPSPAGWTQQTKTFTTPADATSFTVYHLIAAVGTLEIDDVALPDPTIVPLTATLTAPTTGATIGGAAVALSATTSGAGVLGVQFKVDGVSIGVEDLTAPYALTWDSTTVTDGGHVVTAVVRTAAATATSPPVPITSSNAPPTQLVVNPSVEIGSAAPSGWTSRIFGANTTAFTWSATGHTGTRSLRIDTTARTSGDAKWYFAPVAINAATTYTYSYWSRSTVVGQIVAEYKTVAGVVTTKYLADIPASPAAWTQRSKVFTTPIDAASMTIYHLIAAVGSLEIDDASLPPVSPTITSVSLTAPAAAAVVSGVAVPLSVATSGNGIVGVQYRIDGINIGAEVTISPYSGTWDTSLWVNGNHTIAAILRTAATTLTSANQTVSVANAPPPELLTNGSLELASGEIPTGWSADIFGVSVATLSSTATGGHGGGRYAHTAITSWTTGDAKWVTVAAVAVAGGMTYRFTDWYRAVGPTEVVAEITLSNGSAVYLALADSASPVDWTRYTSAITVPAAAVSMRIWHSLIGVGSLDADDYSVKLEVASRFIEPLLTLTFDDGNSSDVTVALPTLQANGQVGTFYLASGYLGTLAHLTNAQALQLKDAGMEIGAHTITHPDLTTLSPAVVQAQLLDSKIALEALLGVPVPNFASPFGAYNADVLSRIKAIYGSHRTTLDGFNSRKGMDTYQLMRQTISPATTVAQVTGWINQAKADGAWLILVFHDIGPIPTTSGTTPALFAQMMQAVKDSAVPVRTMAGALAEIVPQLPA